MSHAPHAHGVTTHLVELGAFRRLGYDAVDLRLVLRKPEGIHEFHAGSLNRSITLLWLRMVLQVA